MSAHKSAARRPGASGNRPPKPPRLDASSLAGITVLMNPSHLRPGVNSVLAERQFLSGEDRSAPAPPATADITNHIADYDTELNRLAKELGLDIPDSAEPQRAESHAPQRAESHAPQRAESHSHASHAPQQPGPRAEKQKIQDLDFASLVLPTKKSKRTPSVSSASGSASTASGSGSRSGSGSGSGSSEASSCDCESECSSRCSCDCHCDCDSDCSSRCSCDCHSEGTSSSGSRSSRSSNDNDRVDDILDGLETELGIKGDSGRRRRVHSAGVPNPGDRSRRRSSSEISTGDVRDVVAGLRGDGRTPVGAERERLHDLKASKLEQIGQLRMTLEEEDIDCAGIATPTLESSMTDIDEVLNVLRLKNDRNRYSSLAEEVILGVAGGIETVFDGSRSVPLLGWRPDYTGYHNTVNTKLHRMRFETAQLVGTIIERHRVGPTARILMELLPSFFLYPRQQKRQRGVPGLSSDPRIGDTRGALGAIRASDSRAAGLDDLNRF